MKMTKHLSTLALIAVICLSMFVVLSPKAKAATVPVVVSSSVNESSSSITLPGGADIYLYGYGTGGGAPSGSFSYGQITSLTNQGGNVVAALAATTSNNNYFSTGSGYPVIGGVGVQSFSSYSSSFGTNNSPAAPSASDSFTVATSGSLVVVIAIGGDEQSLSVSGLSGLQIDAAWPGSPWNSLEILHTYLNAGAYVVTEYTSQSAAGQTPAYAGDLIGVFVFTPSGSSTVPAVVSSSVNEYSSSITLPVGADIYLYGYATGAPSGDFVYGQYESLMNHDGQEVGSLAVTTSNTNNFPTSSMFPVIGGIGVKGFSSYASSFGSNNTPGPSSTSDSFAVTVSGSLVVVIAIGGDEALLSVSGLPNLQADASWLGPPLNALQISHTYLSIGSYTVTEYTSQSGVAGQDPAHAGDLIGVFVFSPSGSFPSSTCVTCSPNPVFAGLPATCTATVSGSNPTGIVTWSTSSSTGSFSSSTSSLPSGSCSTTYTDISAGTVTITASYSGDPDNAPSSGSTTLTVNAQADFQLKVSPTTQSVPITGDANFSVEIMSVNGFSSSVQLSISGLPGIFSPSFSLPTLQPYQTSLQISYLTFYVNQAAQIGQSYPFTITATATSEQIFHSQNVAIVVTKTVGLENLISIAAINEQGILPTFSIQQNFFVQFPGSSGTEFRYWVQNMICIKNQGLAGYWAASVIEIWNYTSSDTGTLIAGDPASYVPILHVSLTLYINPFSFPAVFNFTSFISGSNLEMYNNYTSWGWPIPYETGQEVIENFNTFVLNYNSQNPSLGRQSPEFVLVGTASPPWAASASFLSQTRAPYQTTGSIQCKAELMDKPWTSSVLMAIASKDGTMTQETSSGLTFLITSENTASFSSSGGWEEGVFIVPMSSSLLEGGATTETQPTVSVTISGSSATDGTPVTILASLLSGLPIGVAPVGTPTAAYYDVKVQGISDGTATVCITSSGVLGQTTMQYWNGAQWVIATDVVVSGNTICGNIPVSVLAGTPIAIGPIVDNIPPTTGIVFGQPSIDVAGRVFLVGSTPVSLTATDNLGGSGVSSTAYRIYNDIYESGWQNHTTQFNLSSLMDGNYTIAFNSTDNAGNIENTNNLNVTLVGPDINRDGKVDMNDIAIAAKAFGTVPGDPGWNPIADINLDGKVDLRDIGLIARMFGTHYP